MGAEFDRFRAQFGDHWCLAWTDDPWPGQVCTLAPAHDGDHEARHVKTGQLFKTWPSAENAPELSISCPCRTCSAGTGEPCRTSTGVVRAEPHGLRWLWLHPGPLVRCPGGPCAACRWTGWAPQAPGGVSAQ